jgi:hypothetical protein
MGAVGAGLIRWLDHADVDSTWGGEHASMEDPSWPLLG